MLAAVVAAVVAAAVLAAAADVPAVLAAVPSPTKLSEKAHLGVLQGPQKHLIQPQGVSPISVHHIIWVHHVAAAFAHLMLLSSHQGIGVLRPHQPVPLLLHLSRVKPASIMAGSTSTLPALCCQDCAYPSAADAATKPTRKQVQLTSGRSCMGPQTVVPKP